jgi:hypothetical protein
MDPMTIALIVKAAIPIISPLVVAVVKHFFPGLTGVTLPVLSTGVGAATDVMAGAATGTDGSAVVGGILGLAGVGVREFYDQAKRTPLVRTLTKDGTKLGCLLVAGALLTACATAPGARPAITPTKIRLLTMAMAVAAQEARPLADQERQAFAHALQEVEAVLAASPEPPTMESFQTTLLQYVPSRWAPLAGLAIATLTEEVDLAALSQAQGSDAVRPYFLAAVEGLVMALAPTGAPQAARVP